MSAASKHTDRGSDPEARLLFCQHSGQNTLQSHFTARCSHRDRNHRPQTSDYQLPPCEAQSQPSCCVLRTPIRYELQRVVCLPQQLFQKFLCVPIRLRRPTVPAAMGESCGWSNIRLSCPCMSSTGQRQIQEAKLQSRIGVGGPFFRELSSVLWHFCFFRGQRSRPMLEEQFLLFPACYFRSCSTCFCACPRDGRLPHYIVGPRE